MFFTRRYPCALDVALENRVKNVISDDEKSLLHQFISLTMSCGKYQVGNHTVFFFFFLFFFFFFANSLYNFMDYL